MPLKIFKAQSPNDFDQWDEYVRRHPEANLYHLSGWKAVIENAYRHSTYYLMATSPQSSALCTQNCEIDPPHCEVTTQSSALSTQHSVIGILPLVHMRHFLFGNKLVSIPFFDMGGILADSDGVAEALIEEAVSLGRKLKVETIELRHTRPLSWLERKQESPPNSQTNATNIKNTTNSTKLANQTNKTNSTNITNFTDQTSKVRMLLELPDSGDELMKSFKSKLRSQIRKPGKEGLVARTGGSEMIDDFYDVFCVNMRDLGSPVHSKRLIQAVLDGFADNSIITLVYKANVPVAASLTIGFKDTLENPWASSLREFSRFSPNMLLYWSMLEYACENGYRQFDFGRSTPGEGTFNFKSQWGAQPQPLFWHTFHLDGRKKSNPTIADDKSKFERAIQCWQKLPVPVTRIIGPMIRKHIAL